MTWKESVIEQQGDSARLRRTHADRLLLLWPPLFLQRPLLVLAPTILTARPPARCHVWETPPPAAAPSISASNISRIPNPGKVPNNTDLPQILVSTLWIPFLSVTKSSCL